MFRALEAGEIVEPEVGTEAKDFVVDGLPVVNLLGSGEYFC